MHLAAVEIRSGKQKILSLNHEAFLTQFFDRCLGIGHLIGGNDTAALGVSAYDDYKSQVVSVSLNIQPEIRAHCVRLSTCQQHMQGQTAPNRPTRRTGFKVTVSKH